MLRRLGASIVPAAVPVEPRPGAFPLMDAMRAIAALLIFAFHAFSLLSPASPAARDVVQTLTVGVPVFFLISGFLLYRPFVAASLAGTSAPALAPYAWRRVLRLVPGFWVALTAVLAVRGDLEPTGAVLGSYAFAQVYDPANAVGLSQAWSLDCEALYYVAVPLVALGLAGRARGAGGHVVAALALVAGSFAFKLWALTWGTQDLPGGQTLLLQPGWNLDLFAAGMLLATWSAHGADDPLRRLAAARPGLLWLSAAGTFAAAAALADRSAGDAGLLALHALDALFAVLLVLPAVAGPPLAGALRRRVLANRGLLAVGVVSYGIYLWHVLILEEVIPLRDRIGGPAALVDAALVAASLALTVAVAVASWLLVERPALGLRHVVPGRAPAASVPVAGVP